MATPSLQGFGRIHPDEPTPSPMYPWSQVQIKDPGTRVHVASGLQPLVPIVQGSTGMQSGAPPSRGGPMMKPVLQAQSYDPVMPPLTVGMVTSTHVEFASQVYCGTQVPGL